MSEEELMINFAALSFSTLSIGAVALAWLTLYGKGHRFFAIFLAVVSLGMGVYFVLNFAAAGWVPTGLGALALLLSVLPGKRDSNDAG